MMKINSLLVIVIFSVLFNSSSVYSRKFITKGGGLERFKDKHWLNANSWFKIVPLQEILKNNPQVNYKKVADTIPFDAPEFSICPKFPRKGCFNELFVLTVPHGMVQGEQGHVFINGQLSDEMARGERFETFRAPQVFLNNIKKVSGRVAVIAQLGSTNEHPNYYHWIFEVLGRLAMLEMAGIEYDWLYVGKAKKFMKETLELWGVDLEKIIEPISDNFAVQADEIIVPSMVINTSCGHAQAGSFQHPVTSKYVREKLLQKVLEKNIDSSKFSRRVFVSRKDAFNAKRILNEDEIFALFQEKGFESYELAKLSVADQITLFHNAEIVVSEQSSGLTNILFCKPNTVVVEIFQLLIDNCFWWVTYMCNLKYVPIMTLSTDVEYFADHRKRSYGYMMKAFFSQVNVPLENIKKMIETL